MLRKRITKRILCAWVLLFMVVLPCIPAFAYGQVTATVPVYTNEPAMVYVAGLDGTPCKLCRVDGKGSLALAYDEPGTYEYLAWQILDREQDNAAYDERVWYIRVLVSDNGHGGLYTQYLVSNSETGEKVSAMEFRNDYADIPAIPEATAPAVAPPDPAEDVHAPDNSVVEQVVSVFIPNQEVRVRVVRQLKDIFEEFGDLETPLALFVGKTGDTSPVLLYLVIIITVIAAAVVVTCVAAKKRKRGHGEA